jgi:hypothetical protein
MNLSCYTFSVHKLPQILAGSVWLTQAIDSCHSGYIGQNKFLDWLKAFGPIEGAVQNVRAPISPRLLLTLLFIDPESVERAVRLFHFASFYFH